MSRRSRKGLTDLRRWINARAYEIFNHSRYFSCAYMNNKDGDLWPAIRQRRVSGHEKTRCGKFRTDRTLFYYLLFFSAFILCIVSLTARTRNTAIKTERTIVFAIKIILYMYAALKRLFYLQKTCLPICVITGLDHIQLLVAVAGL